MAPTTTCPCCDARMKLRADKTGKPYMNCPEGHAQLFVKSAGLDRFTAKYGTDWKGGASAPEPKSEKPSTPAKAKPAPAAKKAEPKTEEPAAATPAKKGGASGFFG